MESVCDYQSICYHTYIEKNGYFVCCKCGLTSKEQVCVSQEKRTYSKEDRDAKTHTGSWYHGINNTKIVVGKDAKNQMLNSSVRYKFNHLIKIDMSIASSLERNLYRARYCLQLLNEKYQMPF